MAVNSARNRRAGHGMWWLALFVPVALTVVLFFPRNLAQQEEGLFAEMLGGHIAFSDDFYTFAPEVRRWGVTVLAVAILIGIGFWSLTKREWHNRLRSLDAGRTRGFRTLVLRDMVIAGVIALVVGCGLFVLPGSLRTMPLPSWAMVAGLCAVVAAAQYFATLWGITETRRLFRGR